MTRQEYSARRAKIVRRQAAQRISRSLKEIWKKRRGDEDADDESSAGNDPLADLPDGLLG